MSISRNRKFYSGFNKSVWWTQKRERLYRERSGTCQICNEKKSIRDLTLHHIIPKSIGGRDIDVNLMLICVSCHRKKN